MTKYRSHSTANIKANIIPGLIPDSVCKIVVYPLGFFSLYQFFSVGAYTILVFGIINERNETRDCNTIKYFHRSISCLINLGLDTFNHKI